MAKAKARKKWKIKHWACNCDYGFYSGLIPILYATRYDDNKIVQNILRHIKNIPKQSNSISQTR